MPVIDKGSQYEAYEGAIVLSPKCDLYLDNPVACVDYASLYPSSMISENLSHDSKVWTKEYDLDGDGWSVDLDSEYHMKSEFETMFSEMENWDYPASSVILVKNGTIVHEEYYEDFSYKTQFNTYSVTKSFLSTIYGRAEKLGLISNIDKT